MLKLRLAVLFFCLAVLLSYSPLRASVSVGIQGRLLDEDPPHSDWIVQLRTDARLSKLGLPAADPTSRKLLAHTKSLLVSAPKRVSGDLLPAGSTAQPETQAEPHLHANPLNDANLVAAYQESRFANGGARALNYSTSFDGGASWTEGILPGLTVAAGGQWDRASDPWVAFGPNHQVYFVSLLFNQSNSDNAIAVSRSTDGGATWSNPVIVHRTSADFDDKETITVDTYPQSRHFGNVYVGWDINKFTNGQVTAQQMVVARSTDGGASWAKPKKLRKQGANVGIIPRVGPDGTVYAVWSGGSVQGTTASIFFSKSSNGGKKWSAARKLTTILTNGVNGFRSGSFLPAFDVNPLTGELYIAWSDGRWTGQDQPTLITSTDQGATWSAPARLSDNADDAPVFTLSLATNRLGHVAVSYYTLQNDPQRRFLVDQYITLSRDNGATFEPALRVTAESFDARFAARAGNNIFLGDYAGLAGLTRGFQLLWVAPYLDSVQTPGRLQPDVFSATVE